MMTFKNAIGYIRVSTERQADDDKYGIEVQKQAILLYANDNGYNIVDWKVDEISGAKDDRPGLNEILYGDDVSNPPYEAVIVFKNDRVARDTKLYFYYLYVLEKKNIKLLSTQESFTEGSKFANIYRALLQFVAEQERSYGDWSSDVCSSDLKEHCSANRQGSFHQGFLRWVQRRSPSLRLQGG